MTAASTSTAGGEEQEVPGGEDTAVTRPLRQLLESIRAEVRAECLAQQRQPQTQPAVAEVVQTARPAPSPLPAEREPPRTAQQGSNPQPGTICQFVVIN